MVLVLASALPAFASGGSDCEELNCSTFFSPAVIQNPYESVLFRTKHSIYTGTLNAQMQVINQKEWSQYFGDAIPQDLLATLLYKMSIEDLDAALEFGRRTQDRTIAPLRDALVAYGNADRVYRSLEYLKLARSVDPLATRNLQQGWVYPPVPKPVIIVDTEKLIA